jgi:polysaccharide export outer membrane protein
MKKVIIAVVIAIFFLSISAVGQVKPPFSAKNHPNTTRAAETTDTRSRVVPPTTSTPAAGQPASKAWGNASVTISERPRLASANSSPVAPVSKSTTLPAVVTNISPTQLYRVGVGDILDIQIEDSMSTRSTLYTVTEGGMLDYPLATGSLSVAGLTTDDIAVNLRASIKVLNNPPVTVKVRDFASHTVNVIGFVSVPGTKVLRREAVPMYVIISESMPLAEATTATVIRDGKTAFVAGLKDQNALNQLLMPGDLIRISGNAAAAAGTVAEYYYVGGEVNAPGQKAFHPGITLTQSIIASGGKSLNGGNIVRVSRQNADGRLASAEYNLQNIQNGKTPDPQIQKGDRIEIRRN